MKAAGSAEKMAWSRTEAPAEVAKRVKQEAEEKIPPSERRTGAEAEERPNK